MGLLGCWSRSGKSEQLLLVDFVGHSLAEILDVLLVESNARPARSILREQAREHATIVHVTLVRDVLKKSALN